MLPLPKVAAVVVLYHPGYDVISNINTYYQSINHVIITDNSEKDNEIIKHEIEQKFPNVTYLSLRRNTGIAAALNIACELAIQDNCDWILTMDQDSSFKPGELTEMIKGIPAAQAIFKNIAILSPFHVLHKEHSTKSPKQYSVKNIVMTSGNLLNLSAYARIGPFEEKLFLDFVDYEYCLRIRKNNYKIIQNNFVHLKHSLGTFKIKKLFNLKISVTNHNSVRRYYISRNSLYVGFKYFDTDKIFFFHMLKNILFRDPFVILLYEKNKFQKMKSFYKGIYHFVVNKFGKAV